MQLIQKWLLLGRELPRDKLSDATDIPCKLEKLLREGFNLLSGDLWMMYFDTDMYPEGSGTYT